MKRKQKGIYEFDFKSSVVELPFEMENELSNFGCINTRYFEERTINPFNSRRTACISPRKFARNPDIPLYDVFGKDLQIRSFGYADINPRAILHSKWIDNFSIDAFLDSYLILVPKEFRREVVKRFKNLNIKTKIVGELGFIFVKRPNYNNY